MANLTETMARRAMERSMAERQTAYADEMQRIVDATYRLIERSGSLEPTLRSILRETGLSTQAFYRYFQSKDELYLLLLDDGRRQLLGYLEHRVAKAADPAARLYAWIDGVLAQAANPGAAARTRPFVVNEARLIEAFPEEQQASVDLLVDQLASIIQSLPAPAPRTSADARQAGAATYDLVFGRLQHHLVHHTTPTAAEVEHLVGFATRGASA